MRAPRVLIEEAMESIWIEDEYKLQAPREVQVINSEKPELKSKMVELPPLPPTSYFQSLLMPTGENKTKKKRGLSRLLDKLNGEQVYVKPRPKISTPYGFNHIGHVAEDTTVVGDEHEHGEGKHHDGEHYDGQAADAPADANSRDKPVAINTTSSIPRSTSQQTSLVSSTFTRNSVVTRATSISTKKEVEDLWISPVTDASPCYGSPVERHRFLSSISPIVSNEKDTFDVDHLFDNSKEFDTVEDAIKNGVLFDFDVLQLDDDISSNECLAQIPEDNMI